MLMLLLFLTAPQMPHYWETMTILVKYGDFLDSTFRWHGFSSLFRVTSGTAWYTTTFAVIWPAYPTHLPFLPDSFQILWLLPFYIIKPNQKNNNTENNFLVKRGRIVETVIKTQNRTKQRHEHELGTVLWPDKRPTNRVTVESA